MIRKQRTPAGNGCASRFPALLTRALAIVFEAQSPGHRYLCVARTQSGPQECLYGLAQLADLERNGAEAELYYRRAVSAYERSFGPMHPELVPVLQGYARLLRSKHSSEAKKIEARVKEMQSLGRVAGQKTGSDFAFCTGGVKVRPLTKNACQFGEREKPFGAFTMPF